MLICAGKMNPHRTYLDSIGFRLDAIVSCKQQFVVTQPALMFAKRQRGAVALL
jgi:hypothetical protein